jgi:hypothetical protein
MIWAIIALLCGLTTIAFIVKSSEPRIYHGPDNPTPIPVGRVYIGPERLSQPKRDPNREIAPPPRGGSGVPRR